MEGELGVLAREFQRQGAAGNRVVGNQRVGFATEHQHVRAIAAVDAEKAHEGLGYAGAVAVVGVAAAVVEELPVLTAGCAYLGRTGYDLSVVAMVYWQGVCRRSRARRDAESEVRRNGSRPLQIS